MKTLIAILLFIMSITVASSQRDKSPAMEIYYNKPATALMKASLAGNTEYKALIAAVSNQTHFLRIHPGHTNRYLIMASRSNSVARLKIIESNAVWSVHQTIPLKK